MPAEDEDECECKDELEVDENEDGIEWEQHVDWKPYEEDFLDAAYNLEVAIHLKLNSNNSFNEK